MVCLGAALAAAAVAAAAAADTGIPPLYDLDLATRSATLSSIAYCIEDIESWSCAYCTGSSAVKGVKPFAVLTNESTDTHGFVAVDHDARQVYVVFRGTEDLENWITDLNGFTRANFTLPSCSNVATGVLIHDGFYLAYESVQPQMLDALQRLERDGAGGYNLVVTGHSLGAALATLAAVDVVCGAGFPTEAKEGGPFQGQVNMLNFGSPRIGEVPFYDLVSHTLSGQLRVLRHTHWRDPVPHLPLAAMNYHHVAREYFLEEYWSPPQGNMSVHECDGSGEDPNCADQFYLAFEVEDHLHYLDIYLSHKAC